MAFCIEKRNTWLVVFFEQFWSCLQGTSYILVETVLHPAAPLCYHGYWDCCEEEMPRINNPPLEAAASDSVKVAVSKLLTESTCLGYQFWQLIFSCRGSLKSKLSIPDFVSHCLEICLPLHWYFSKQCKTKMGQKAWVGGCWSWSHAYTHI